MWCRSVESHLLSLRSHGFPSEPSWRPHARHHTASIGAGRDKAFTHLAPGPAGVWMCVRVMPTALRHTALSGIQMPSTDSFSRAHFHFPRHNREQAQVAVSAIPQGTPGKSKTASSPVTPRTNRGRGLGWEGRCGFSCLCRTWTSSLLHNCLKKNLHAYWFEKKNKKQKKTDLRKPIKK